MRRVPTLVACLGLALFVNITLSLKAQDTATLHIGDVPPPIRYSKWIQGSPKILSLDPNKVYVVEFWATWCGPCVQAMPHLSGLSKKYAGRITFVGVDVWENSHDADDKRPQETYLPKVVQFVQGQEKLGRLTYNVVADNNAEDMGKNWLKAAGIEGIPSSFVIQNGKIAWIGHPYYLDSILTSVNAGKFDVEGTVKKINGEKQKRLKMDAQLAEGQGLYKGAVDAKDYDKALVLIDTAVARYPNYSYRFAEDKWKILREHYGDDQVLAYGQALEKDHLLGQLVVIWLYMDKEPQAQRSKEFAIEACKRMDPNGVNYRVWNYLADLQARAGHYSDAAASARKAAEVAKADMDGKNFNGDVTQMDIDGFIEKAAGYQKKADEEQHK